ncbi:MAG: hypothetical protein ABJL72_01690 [Roseobacter sp.]
MFLSTLARVTSVLVLGLWVSNSAHASTYFELEFEAIITQNECRGGPSEVFGDCELTYGGLNVGQEYSGTITISNAFSRSNTGERQIDFTQNWELPSFLYQNQADISCSFAGIECYSQGTITQLIASYNYDTQTGTLQIFHDNVNEFYLFPNSPFGREGLVLVDDQGEIWQSFSAVPSSWYGRAVQVETIPLTSSMQLLLTAFFLTGVLAFLRNSKKRVSLYQRPRHLIVECLIDHTARK